MTNAICHNRKEHVPNVYQLAPCIHIIAGPRYLNNHYMEIFRASRVELGGKSWTILQYSNGFGRLQFKVIGAEMNVGFDEFLNYLSEEDRDFMFFHPEILEGKYNEE